MAASILVRLHGIFFYGVLHRGPLRMSLLSRLSSQLLPLMDGSIVFTFTVYMATDLFE